RPAGGHADADLAGAAGISLGGKATALLVPRQNRAQPGADARQRLVDRHARASGVGKDDFDPVVEQALDEDIGSGLQSPSFFGHGGNTPTTKRATANGCP